MAQKVVTIGQVLDAIEQNGLPQAFNKFFVGKGGRFVSQRNPAGVGAACAVGQGAYNLGVEARSLERMLSSGYVEVQLPDNALIDRGLSQKFYGIASAIEQLNDKYRIPVPEIARLIRNALDEKTLSTQIAVQEYNYR